MQSMFHKFPCKRHLTHWGRERMAAISHTTFLNAFSWMKIYEFRLKFHWSLFPRVQLTIFHYWFRQWLGADRVTSHYLNQWWLDYRRIYASLGLNELKHFQRNIYTHGLCFFYVVQEQSILTISFKITSLSRGQSYNCPSASEAIQRDMNKWKKMK